MPKKMYVGNLNFKVEQSDLENLFSQYGNVEEAVLIMDRMTGRSKGFGFVTMSDEDANTAMSELDGKDFEGRPLRVNEARPREDRGSRGGGGGYGGGGGGRY